MELRNDSRPERPNEATAARERAVRMISEGRESREAELRGTVERVSRGTRERVSRLKDIAPSSSGDRLDLSAGAQRLHSEEVDGSDERVARVRELGQAYREGRLNDDRQRIERAADRMLALRG